MTTIKSIKTKAIVALVLSVLAFVPVVGVVFTIAFYAVMFFAVKGVKEISQSPTLLRNFAIFVGLMVLGVLLAKFSSNSIGSALEFAATGNASSLMSGTAMSILKVVVAVAGVVYGFFYYREMSRLSGINLFFIAYVFVLLNAVLGALPFISWIAWLFALVAFVFELIAWIKLEHINKATVAMM